MLLLILQEEKSSASNENGKNVQKLDDAKNEGTVPLFMAFFRTAYAVGVTAGTHKI